MRLGQRLVKFTMVEGVLKPVGATVLRENAQGVQVTFDDTGEMPELAHAAVKSMFQEGCCVVCSNELRENAQFCGNCGATNIYETLDKLRAALKVTGDTAPEDIHERVIAFAKSRPGARSGRAKAVAA